MKYKIGIIKPNNFTFEKENHYMKKETIYNELQDLIEIYEIEENELMETIIDKINLNINVMGDTLNCYENEKELYQICFKCFETDNNLNEETNKLSSYLVYGKEIIKGTSIILKNKIQKNRTCLLDNVNIEEITEIFYKKNVHKCVKINTDETLEELEFLNHPCELITFNSNVEEKDISIMKSEKPMINSKFLLHDLIIILDDENCEENQINKIATRIIGNKIKGNIIMCLKNDDFEFGDLTIDLVKKMQKIGNLSLNERIVNLENETEKDKESELKKIINKEIILEEKLNENIENICSGCEKNIVGNKKICTGCYISQYHDEECQKKHWCEHKKECFKDKSYINDLVKKHFANKAGEK